MTQQVESGREAAPAGSEQPRSKFRIGVEALPYIPKPSVPWRASFFLIWIGVLVFIVTGVVKIFMQKWYAESLGVEAVFWTNFKMGAVLFLLYGALYAAAVYVPIRLYARSRALRNSGIHMAIWAWVIAGSIFSWSYHPYLLAFNGVPFEKTDMVFGHDLGFYVYVLPAIWITFKGLLFAGLTATLFFLVARFNGLGGVGGAFRKAEVTFWKRFALIPTRGFAVILGSLGVLAAVATFLSRYSLLTWNHYEEETQESAGVLAGATYLDVRGFFSNVNALYVTTVALLAVTFAIAYVFVRIHQAHRHLELEGVSPGPAMRWRRPAVLTVVGLVLLDGAFFGAVRLRNLLFVLPNEPYIQKDFIQAHMDGTLDGYNLSKVQVVEWSAPETNLTSEELLASKTVQNAPFMPGFVSFGNRNRNAYLKGGKNALYAPVLEVYQQEQQLRPYYQIVNVDNVRYRLNGEKQMFATATRELPAAGILDKGKFHWGSSALQYTHGMGLIISPANKIDPFGGPLFASKDIPPKVTDPFFEVEPRIYFGEGSTGRHILTNIRHIREFDYATPQFREESEFPGDIGTGIPIDSIFKRLIVALWSYQPDLDRNEIAQTLFSGYIDHQKTRLQLYRGPSERVRAIAPFLFVDGSSHVASVCDNRIVWLVNCMTHSRWYPFSRYREFDETDEDGNEIVANYVRDAVKVSIDAYSGETIFYKIADEPIINSWAKIYPDLFRPMSEMPPSVVSQINYPLQLFHMQFDDTYKRYHMRNYLEFYNTEDQWDDSDEALGPVSKEKTVPYEATHMLVDPRDLPPGADIQCTDGDTQYVLYQPFTPKDALNLRALIMVFQDPENYGKMVSYQVPQGEWMTGPEQADAIIDADRDVNVQLTLWERSGCEALNGHTILLPVKGDLLYLEPIFVRSTMNYVPQLKLFTSYYRGHVAMGKSLKETIESHGLTVEEVGGGM